MYRRHVKTRLVLLLALALAWAGCGGPAESTMPGTFAVELRPTEAVDASQLEAAAVVLAARVAAMDLDVGVRTTEDGVALDVPTALDARSTLDMLLVPGRLWFVAVPPAVEPPGVGQAVNPDWGVLLDEAAIDRAATAVGSQPVDGGSTIEIALLPEAARAFEEWTASHIGQNIAIALDGKVLIAPMIQDAIPGGRVTIQSGSGGFDRDEARRIVALLTSGPLEIELRP
jgi:preprotein translocase subunit SecD